MEWNRVIYQDCMNEENGLPTLEDKSIDLCFTDPPYGVNFRGKNNGKYLHPNEIFYKDNFSFEWQKLWFEEILRICEGVIFTCGTKYMYDWIRYKKPSYPMKIWYKSNACGFFKYDPLLFYGKIKGWKYIRDVVDILLKPHPLGYFLHPTPKTYIFWYYILSKLKPKSVIDPFIGSGTTAEVCTKLGIPWLGYEINEVYSQDINKRLKNCKKEPKQMELML